VLPVWVSNVEVVSLEVDKQILYGARGTIMQMEAEDTNGRQHDGRRSRSSLPVLVGGLFVRRAHLLTNHLVLSRQDRALWSCSNCPSAEIACIDSDWSGETMLIEQ
jgi:hypothetical protein